MIERKFPVFSVILIGILLRYRQTNLQYFCRFGTSFVERYPCLGVDVVGDVDVDVDGGVDGDHAASCSSMLHMNVCLCWFVWSCFLLFAFFVVFSFVYCLFVFGFVFLQREASALKAASLSSHTLHRNVSLSTWGGKLSPNTFK